MAKMAAAPGRTAFAASAALRATSPSHFTPGLTCRTRPPRAAAAGPASLRAIAGEPQVSVSGVDGDAEDAGPSAISSLQDVQHIVELAKEFELADFRLADGGVTVEISMPGGRGFKDGKLQDQPAPPATVAAPMLAPGAYGPPPPREAGEVYEEEEEEEEELVDDDDEAEMFAAPTEAEADEDGVFPTDFVVTSSRVGFFFSGAKGKPPLANVDDHVAFNQPVCIIEQLGQQYVYLSEVSGTVVKIFVEDGDAIMFGSKVMVIRPD